MGLFSAEEQTSPYDVKDLDDLVRAKEYWEDYKEAMIKEHELSTLAWSGKVKGAAEAIYDRIWIFHKLDKLLGDK